MLLLELIHKFNFFLNTLAGNLFLRSLEFVIFTLIVYMVASEYLRSRDIDLKFMLIAFLILAAQKLVLTIILAYQIFLSLSLQSLIPFIPLIDNGIETFAISLLAFAFVLPLIRISHKKLRKYYIYGSIILLVFCGIMELVWYFAYKNNPSLLFSQFWPNTVFTLVDIAILSVPIYLWLFNAKKSVKYRYNIIAAFSAYLVIPILDLINIIFYNNTFSNLNVAQTPFPFISVFLFAQVVYQRLADKAKLLEQLKASEKKYVAEKELGKLKDEFVSVVSHELRTPLTSMKLHSALLKEGKFGTLSDEQKEAVGIIDEEINRLALLVNDILDVSKLESGRYKPKMEKTDVAKIVSESHYYVMARKKGLAIIKNIPDSLVVNVDPEKFRQLFINLLSNAIKYTEKGKITVVLSESKNNWELSVSDSGRGIEKKKIPKLFDKFYQVDDYMTRTQQGTGLGLAIVKKIVEMHKGRIFVDSKLGKGSIFRVVFRK